MHRIDGKKLEFSVKAEVLFSRYENHHQIIASIGTTAEIYSVKNEMDEASGISTITVLAQGRQRFELLEYKRTVTG